MAQLQPVIQCDRLRAELHAGADILPRIRAAPRKYPHRMGSRQQGVGRRIGGVSAGRLLKQAISRGDALTGAAVELAKATLAQLPCCQAFGRLFPHDPALMHANFRRDTRHHALRDLVLHIKDIRNAAIEPV